jgi:hypothetical protein
MKRFKLSGATAVLLACTVVKSYAGIDLGFDSGNGNLGATINFNGGTFSFSSTSGMDFQITTSTGSGDSIGDKGSISGIYTIGAPTAYGIGGEIANVTGSGVLTIKGQGGTGTLTADITWDSIYQLGTGDNLNINGDVNLSSIQYTAGMSGTEADLIALASGPGQLGEATLDFTLNSATPLSTLATETASIAPYSGNLSTVPEPTTMVAGAMLLLPMGASTLRVLRKKRVA